MIPNAIAKLRLLPREEDVVGGTLAALISYLIGSLFKFPAESCSATALMIGAVVVLITRLVKLSNGYLNWHLRYLKSLSERRILTEAEVDRLCLEAVRHWHHRKMGIPIEIEAPPSQLAAPESGSQEPQEPQEPQEESNRTTGNRKRQEG